MTYVGQNAVITYLCYHGILTVVDDGRIYLDTYQILLKEVNKRSKRSFDNQLLKYTFTT